MDAGNIIVKLLIQMGEMQEENDKLRERAEQAEAVVVDLVELILTDDD